MSEEVVWCSGAVVAVTFGRLLSLEVVGDMVVGGEDEFQKAVGKVI